MDNSNVSSAAARDTAHGSRWVAWIIHHPVASIVLSLLLLAGLGAGAKRLSFSNDIRVFFSPSNPDLKAFQALEQTYSKGTNVLMVVSARKAGGTLFTPDHLAALQRLTADAWKTPYSRRVDSLTNFQYSRAEGDDLMVSDLVPDDASTLSATDIEHIKGVALADPLLVHRLISPDGSVTGINIPITLPGKNPLTEQPEVVAYARKLASDAEARWPDLRVQLTGIIIINQELANEAAHDFATLVPAMFAFIIITLGLMLRSAVAPFCAFLVILLANIAAFGAAGWLGITLSPPVISAVNMIMTLAIADSVHIMAAYRQNYRGGISRAEAMRRSLDHSLGAVFFTSFTTVLGFLSLNTSESPPFRDLGNVVAIGVAFAWVFVHTILPPLVILLPGKPKPEHAVSAPGAAFFAGIARLVTRKPVGVLVVSSAITLLLAGGILRNELNDEFVKYFDSSSAFRQATEFTIDRLTGFEYIDYSLDSGSPGGIADPEYLRKVEAFAEWFRQQPKVRHVYAHSEIIKRLYKNLHGDDPAYYRIPEDAAAATDCLTVFELSLPFGLDLTDRINLDKSATLFHASLGSITSNEMIALDERAQAWLTEHDLSPASRGTGQSLMFARIGLRNIRSLLSGTVMSLVLISLCMVFITRSWTLGLASLLPNLAPAAIGFGVWGILVGKVGLAISVVVGMTLGIVVDDTIHFMNKFLELHRKHGVPAREATERSVIECGWPMVTSSVALVGGFGILGFSTFELNKGMGILSAMVIAIALLFDLIFLPALMLVITRRNESAQPAAA